MSGFCFLGWTVTITVSGSSSLPLTAAMDSGVFPKRYAEFPISIPFNVTLFRNRFFAGVIKLRKVIKVGPNTMTGALRRGKFGHRPHRRIPCEDRNHHMIAEVEIGAMQLQATECQGLRPLLEAGKRQGRIPPYRFQKEHGPTHTNFRLLDSKIVRQ